MNTRTNTAPALNCELLESRTNPDGNVTVGVSNFNVFISGDDFSNHVQLVQDGAGNLFAVGINNTTVNGQGIIFLGQFIPNNVNIVGNGGADTLQVFGLVSTGTLAIAPGEEFDRVDIGNVNAAAVIVSAGAGNDTVVMDNVVGHSLVWVDGGSDTDLLHFSNVVSNSTNVMNFEQFV